MRLAADAKTRPAAAAMLILFTDAPPQPFPKFEENLSATKAHLLKRGVAYLHIVALPAQRRIYEQLWSKEVRDAFFDWTNIALRRTLRSAFGEMIQHAAGAP